MAKIQRSERPPKTLTEIKLHPLWCAKHTCSKMNAFIKELVLLDASMENSSTPFENVRKPERTWPIKIQEEIDGETRGNR